MKKSYYYDLWEDLENFPQYWCYVIIGGRNTGKTYSALKGAKDRGLPFVFIKRTMDDVDLLCAGSGKLGSKQNEFALDLSPFAPINRDDGDTIKPFKIRKGLGGFWRTNEEGLPTGPAVGTLLAMNAGAKYKGFDMSDNELMIFDEFIPQPWERVMKKEGDMLMDLYKTISRDREHRGRPALKLILLANATRASNPVMNTLEITDDVVQLDMQGAEYKQLEDRGILIHKLEDSEGFYKKERESLIYKAMAGTAWGQMALENSFAYDDFSNVQKGRLKGATPLYSILYKKEHWYLYARAGQIIVTRSPFNAKKKVYDLNRDNGQRAFRRQRYLELLERTTMDQVLYETYTMYDVLTNFPDYFKA